MVRERDAKSGGLTPAAIGSESKNTHSGNGTAVSTMTSARKLTTSASTNRFARRGANIICPLAMFLEWPKRTAPESTVQQAIAAFCAKPHQVHRAYHHRDGHRAARQ